MKAPRLALVLAASAILSACTYVPSTKPPRVV